jgi:hypothetical protein
VIKTLALTTGLDPALMRACVNKADTLPANAGLSAVFFPPDLLIPITSGQHAPRESGMLDMDDIFL